MYAAARLAVLALFPQAVPDVPKIPVSAQVVHVDVVVTDKKGNPLGGLDRDDFVLYEDGKVVPVAGFSAPRRSSAAGREALQDRPSEAPPAAPKDASEMTTYVVYIDHANLSVAGRRRVLAGVEKFLSPELSAGRARALVISGNGLVRPRSPLTTRAEEIVRPLREAAEGSAQGQQIASDERSTIALIKMVFETYPDSCAEHLHEAQRVVRAYAADRRGHLEASFAQLTEAVAALATLPGPKSLLYLSDGLDQRPGLHLFNQIGDICPEARERHSSEFYAPMLDFDMSAGLRELAARANAARVTLYPIDGSGLRTHSVTDVSQGRRELVASTLTDNMRTKNLQAGQWILADETGGAPILNANDPGRDLQKLAGEEAGRYVLGFSPEREPDGRSHAIRVELRRKGPRIRHRMSYWHRQTVEVAAGRSLAALFFGLEDDTLGAAVSARLVPSVEGGAPVRLAVVKIVVPLSRLSAVPGGDGRSARLRTVIAVRKERASGKERSVDVREKWIDVPLSSETDDSGSREYVVEVPLVQGEHELAVGVEDVSSSRATFKKLSVDS